MWGGRLAGIARSGLALATLLRQSGVAGALDSGGHGFRVAGCRLQVAGSSLPSLAHYLRYGAEPRTCIHQFVPSGSSSLHTRISRSFTSLSSSRRAGAAMSSVLRLSLLGLSAGLSASTLGFPA